MSKKVRSFRGSRHFHRKKRIPYVLSNQYHWHRRILGAFKQNAKVIKLVLKGGADKWLSK